ncbi:MAG: CDP-glycerol glycerophosphotransferase family protein, partial [Wenzhouxiangella sp.]|nr:CDP-glycerol glycerophosphotransferase family protein [Wenzhouxiangella sp.]
MRDQCPEINAYFVINDEAERERLRQIYGPHFIETRTLKGKFFALQAGVWITSVGLPVYVLGARIRRIVINLWHGMPLKNIGLLQHNLTVWDRLRIRLLHSRSYTSIITTSDFFKPIFTAAFACRPEVIKALGQPRNDALFRPDAEDPVLAGLRQKHAPKKILL